VWSPLAPEPVPPEPPVDAAPWSTTRLATSGCEGSTVAPLSTRDWTTTRSPTATSARSRLPSPFTSATTIRAFETSNVTVWPFRARPRWLPPVTSTSIVPVPTADTVPLTMRARPCFPCLWPALLPPLCPWNAPLPWPPPCATAAAGSASAATTPSATSGRINLEFILPPSETGLPRVLRPLGFAPPPRDGFALSRSFRFGSYQHAAPEQVGRGGRTRRMSEGGPGNAPASMRLRGLEPPRGFPHGDLNAARIPIS